MPLPIVPQTLDKMISEGGTISTYPFPSNVAGQMDKAMRQEILGYMLQNYIWPQVMERQQFEHGWDKLYMMSRAAWKYLSVNDSEETRLKRSVLEKKADGTDLETTVSERLEISDTLIFDTIDRLTNLNHFIGFKESFPCRYEMPEDMIFPYENGVYSPMSDLVKSANCWLKYNVNQHDIYRKYWMNSRHHYTYGMSIVESQFVQEIDPNAVRRDPKNPKAFISVPELTAIGVTFEPMSIRKCWFNWRIPIYDMKYQPCPFYFQQTPRFAIVANQYDAQLRPFGFENLKDLPKNTWLFGGQELDSYRKAFEIAHSDISLDGITRPEFQTQMLWTFYPMLPLGVDASDPKNPKLVFDADGSKGVPFQRFIVQSFGNNLINGSQELLRVQRNFYPNDALPLYGSAHIPTLDDGIYSQPIGGLLEGHYMQCCKTLLQAIENKDWINDPPALVQSNSPAMTQDLNKKGAKIGVNSINDVKLREVYDATGSTPALYELIRSQAQTTSKAVDAIMGKAMGSRTSATEASNIFQTAMSGVTTDVNMQAFDIAGGYATRLWEYTGRWVDLDILRQITGSFGFALRPEHLTLRLGLKWDVGSSFIDSMTRQQNIKFLLQSTQPGDPSINRAYLFEQLLNEWKFKDVRKIINDGGFEQQIQLATEQAILTYRGELVMPDPAQDHSIAMRVKTAFLADSNSRWNTDPATVINGPQLVRQIQIHQAYLQLQMQQQQALQMQQQGLMDAQGNEIQQQAPGASPSKDTHTAGQARQQTGK